MQHGWFKDGRKNEAVVVPIVTRGKAGDRVGAASLAGANEVFCPQRCRPC